MPEDTLHIRQNAPVDGKYTIRLTLERPGRPEAEATLRPYRNHEEAKAHTARNKW